MKILITGANGQVGRAVTSKLSMDSAYQVIATDRSDIDMTNVDHLFDLLDQYDPDIIVNCAAYTAVDAAEEDEENAYKVNGESCKVIAEWCKVHNRLVIHFSSDYVYHSDKNAPILETDLTYPQSVYAKSKLAGDEHILMTNPAHFILRTSWVYDAHGQNFVRTMLSLANKFDQLTVVDDQIGSPSYAPDIADVVQLLIQDYTMSESSIPYGVYHMTNEGVCSWYDFAVAIFDIAGIDIQILPVSSTSYPRPASRPYYSVLSKLKLREAIPHYRIPYWRDSLAQCIGLLSSQEEH